MILLDTCTLLWLVGSQEELSEKAVSMIARNPGAIFISAISGFEIGIKYQKKLLELPTTPMEWIEKVVELHGLTEIPVSNRIAVRSTELPAIHKDPADRIIIATALEHDFIILTPDAHFQKYSNVNIVW